MCARVGVNETRPRCDAVEQRNLQDDGRDGCRSPRLLSEVLASSVINDKVQCKLPERYWKWVSVASGDDPEMGRGRKSDSRGVEREVAERFFSVDEVRLRTEPREVWM